MTKKRQLGLTKLMFAVLISLSIVSCQKAPVAGGFTVAPGHQVEFSKGNLQYVKATRTWRFAEKQNEYAGADNTRIIDTTFWGAIDLFGWGTGNDPLRVSDKDEDYGTFEDWGKQMGGDWRTLTREEWKYLIESRQNAEELYGFAKVQNVKGLVLLPDLWTMPDSVRFFAGKLCMDSNDYLEQDWKRLEAAGAIFLPMAGYRTGKTYSNQDKGRYWSSTPNFVNGAFGLAFGVKFLEMGCYDSRTPGCSVRLVKDKK